MRRKRGEPKLRTEIAWGIFLGWWMVAISVLTVYFAIGLGFGLAGVDPFTLQPTRQPEGVGN